MKTESGNRLAVSDSLSHMREMTLAELAENLAEVAERVEAGETIAITSGGTEIMQLVPTPRANGAAVIELFRKWQEDPPLDDEFAANVTSIREILDTSVLIAASRGRATARASDRELVTMDGRPRFDHLPGITARLVG